MNKHLELFICYKNVINLSLNKFQNYVNLGQQNEHCSCTTSGILDGYLFVIIIYVIFWVSALESREVGNSCMEIVEKYRLFKSYLLMCSVALLFPAPAWHFLENSRLAHSSVDQESRSKAVLLWPTCLLAGSLLRASSLVQENTSPVTKPPMSVHCMSQCILSLR